MEPCDSIEYKETDDVTLEEAERLRHFDDGTAFEWVCPFSRETCYDVDLCWAAYCLREEHRRAPWMAGWAVAKEFGIVKECGLTDAKYLVRKHRIRLTLMPKV